MTLDKDKLLDSILASFSRLDYIKSEDIPGIDLYMDQVTTFMDEHLQSARRHDQDKILTKTMINNYAKNNLLPPPLKKKYSKEHLLVLIFIYYFKGFLSFSDIQSILNPLTERFFHTDNTLNMEMLYEEVFSLERNEIEILKADVKRKYEAAYATFSDVQEEDSEFLHLFSLICMLSFDVYVKKQLIEKLIDEYQDSHFTSRKK
ncbi:MAG: DUF1836 domain-containing protein [Lachnospiraceae bacterium]|nr:DUF1836 domain-containing protein [Lachnospiraceae bacterium]MDD3797041.1 DUF1836 domain-containing protein [Lachnospiraceae bacterium]